MLFTRSLGAMEMRGGRNLWILVSAVACGFTLPAMQLPESGDSVKGKALVASHGCLGCHRISDTGSRVGPNLSEIGARRTPERLQRSIVAPDEEVLAENRFVEVVLKDGSAVRGKLLNHDAMSVQLLDMKEHLRSFRTAEVRGYTILTKALMPSFDAKLSPQELADIVAYLSSLKGTE